jgi:hypothetical protein
VKYDPLAFGVGEDDPTVAAAATAMIGTIHMAACVCVCECVCVAVCKGQGNAGILKNVQELTKKKLESGVFEIVCES